MNRHRYAFRVVADGFSLHLGAEILLHSLIGQPHNRFSEAEVAQKFEIKYFHPTTLHPTESMFILPKDVFHHLVLVVISQDLLAVVKVALYGFCVKS